MIGIVQTFAVAIDTSILSMLAVLGLTITPQTFFYSVWSLKISQIAPVIPFILMVLILIFRPKGLMGTREG